MRYFALVRKLLLDPRAKGLDLDSEEATVLHATLIREKRFLRSIYRHYYRDFVTAHQAAPEGLRLEIGAGGGFLRELIPNVLTVDLRAGAEVDVMASAMDLPFEDASVGAVFLLNVLHHLSVPAKFFSEMTRVLGPGGRMVLIEPYVSPFSKLIYRHLHHEPFDPEKTSWNLDNDSPMSCANGAMPWMLFERDRAKFESDFAGLEIKRVDPHTVLLYLLSGGVSMRALMPGFAFEPLRKLEGALGPMRRYLATMMTVEITRRL